MNPVMFLAWAQAAIQLADYAKKAIEAMHSAGEITDEQLAETFADSQAVDAAWDARVAEAKTRINGGG